MGDLVASTDSGSTTTLHETFNHAISRQNKASRTQLISPLTITLGDEFQGLIRTLSEGASIMREIRIALLRAGVDCRFALGTTQIETPVNRKRAWNMMGPGLSETRSKLNEKRPGMLYRFSLASDKSLESALEAIGATLTSIERSWTKKQLHDITELLLGKSVEDIARLRNVSAHSVYKVRNSGDFDLYNIQWSALMEVLSSLDNKMSLKN